MLVLGGCLLVLAGTAYVAGRSVPAPSVPSGGDAVRLGPEPGERVAGYLARSREGLPAPDSAPVWALVQFSGYLDPAAAAAALDGVGAAAVRVVFRVPLPRVQTALRAEDLGTSADLRAVLASAERQAAAGARRDAADRGRRARVAAAEMGPLAAGCGCVLAVLVRAGPAALRTLAGRAAVRAAQAAPAGTALAAVAVAPLLPEQVELAGPVPDDGRLPGS